MTTTLRILLIAEMQVEDPMAAIEEGQARLDAFREATLPGQNYNLLLYRPDRDDLTGELLHDGWDTIEVEAFLGGETNDDSD